MSKWHRVELTIDQMSEVWKDWRRYDKDAVLEGRIKIRPYRTFVNGTGKTVNEPVRFGTTIPREEIIYVFKFKNPNDAMAFKLEWS